ncbi:thaumatin-like protein [Coprinellus micaceus]|uniref:Thaumatin-like protein n=1 Tax=Coprinellus micaceus TaxID=71717 RepID=A0A4Y7TF98_COPMI|nr:thaumatin-like protein [Coprinellus micaceus]
MPRACCVHPTAQLAEVNTAYLMCPRLIIGMIGDCYIAVIIQQALSEYMVTNGCPFTIWPAIFTDLNVGSAVPSQPNGWEAPAGHTITFGVPDNWKAGRIWGRTACDFSKAGAQSCVTGSCNGGFVCSDHSGAGVPPASLAEFTFDGTDDWYDVSLVDGFNLPMRITPTGGCAVADCPKDLNPECPGEIRGPADGSGSNHGCKSACFANLDSNPADSANCCSGSHNVPATCPPSGVRFYDYFKSGCPNAYAYAYDESSGTALFKCPDGKKADYTITFCP